jgi:hypothetical protein
MSEADMLRYLLTGGNLSSKNVAWNQCGVVEALHVAMDDLDGLMQAVRAEDFSVDLSGVIHRIRMRLEVAAELAQRELDTKGKAPRPRRVIPIKREPGPFADGPVE